MRPPFPSVVDSTMLSTFRSCPRKLELMYLHHWKPSEESVHLVAGSAFAAGIEAARRAFYTEGLPSEESVALGLGALLAHYGPGDPGGESTPKSAQRMGGALEFYFERYPLGADGATPHYFGSAHGIEFSFAEPLDTLHPETGDPILYSGRADMVADAYGGLFLFDEKTASQLGPTWARKWDMRSQFTAYCWGLRGSGINPTGVVVRGVSILKDSYDTQQAITYRSAWEVDRWKAQVEADVARMIQMWASGNFDYNLDDACVAYGGCPFVRVCKSPEPKKWLPLYFYKKRWDPVARTETLIEETPV